MSTACSMNSSVADVIYIISVKGNTFAIKTS